MSQQGNSFYCDNCGDYIGEKDPYNFQTSPPSNATTYRKGGLLNWFWSTLYVFCGDRCKREWKDNNE